MTVTCISRPKTVFHSTASQLGIHKTGGIPSLLDAILPVTASLLQRRYLKRLLLNPPPTEVAASIRKACSLLSGRILVLNQCRPQAPKYGLPDRSELAICSRINVLQRQLLTRTLSRTKAAVFNSAQTSTRRCHRLLAASHATV